MQKNVWESVDGKLVKNDFEPNRLDPTLLSL